MWLKDFLIKTTNTKEKFDDFWIIIAAPNLSCFVIRFGPLVNLRNMRNSQNSVRHMAYRNKILLKSENYLVSLLFLHFLLKKFLSCVKFLPRRNSENFSPLHSKIDQKTPKANAKIKAKMFLGMILIFLLPKKSNSR